MANKTTENIAQELAEAFLREGKQQDTFSFTVKDSGDRIVVALVKQAKVKPSPLVKGEKRGSLTEVSEYGAGGRCPMCGGTGRA